MSDIQVPSTDFNIEMTQGGMKAAIKESGATTRDLLMVPVDKLKIVAGLNVRIHDDEYEAHIERIKKSIVENGFYQHFPLSGYASKEGDNTFIFVVGGFTRLEAAKRAIVEGTPIEALPVVLKPAGTSMADLMLALDIDNSGAPLRPYERAIVIKRLIGYGETEETVSAKMGLSGEHVKNLLYMMGLPNGLRQQVISGRASATHVIQLARKIGPSEALKAFEASAPPATETPPANGAASTTGRVTPRNTAAAAGRAKPIAKKTLFSAIDYALALPSNGIKWLGLWRKGDDDAVKELAAYKPPRKNANPKKPKAGKGKGNGPVDPFDIGDKKPPAGDDAPL